MELKKYAEEFTVCKPASLQDIDLSGGLCFVGVTDEEISLVCPTHQAPENTTARDDGWKGFRIQGELDFSLIGILSRISAVLAENSIGIFVVSTYNTDHIFVKKENFEKAMDVLAEAGYLIV